jgi:N-acyl-D-amino-acid deacylase
MLDLIDAERNDGLDVTFDTYTYEWGGTRLSRLLPMWVQVGGPAKLRERLMDPESRRTIADEVQNSGAARQYVSSTAFSDLRLGNLTHAEFRRFEGRYLSEVVVELDISLGETVCRLVLGNPLATFARPSPHAMTLWKFVTHPLGMIASDSVFIGEAPSPRAYGCFTRVLADFVREERLLSLPEAVRKMTSFPAQRLGLSDRGVLRDGAVADVVIFSLERSHAPASWEEPRRMAEGVDDVFVSGAAVLRAGVMTGSLPGRALRGPAWNRGTALPMARSVEAPAKA